MIANEQSLPPLAAALGAGIESISDSGSVEFRQYTKAVVSPDGFVFWVGGQTAVIPGSLHYASQLQQDETQTYALNDTLFTTQTQVEDFNALETVWVAKQNGIMIAFSGAGQFFGPANVWHYVGKAIYPSMQSQFVDTAQDLPCGPIVSNSLPIWLAQSPYPIYPSFLTPANAIPPYIAVHIDPAQTDALAGAPQYLMPAPGTPADQLYETTGAQLLKDHVKLSLYGLNSQSAAQYLYSLFDYSLNSDEVGFMSSPAIRDDKQTQPESLAIAMRKTIEFDASYNLITADAIARRYILSATVAITAKV